MISKRSKPLAGHWLDPYLLIKSILYYGAMLRKTQRCSGMGIVTGVFEQGNVASGVKHMFIMILITWLIFKFIVGGI